jgi:two-component system, chemotaxis family, chemotaxis protein CheY
MNTIKTVPESFFCIDESEYARTITKKILNDSDYIFLGEATDRSQAITKLKALKINTVPVNYIFLEFSLPDVKATNLIPILKSIHNKSKIIVVTSDASRTTVNGCVKAGADGFVLKPITKEKFLEALNIITINELVGRKETDTNLQGLR